MTTSNSVDFSVTRDSLIKTAFQYATVIGEGDTPSATQVTEASILLNMIVKLRQSDGMPLWALKQGYLLPQTGVSSVNSNSHVTTAYITTTTSAASSLGGSTVTLTSVTGVSNGYNIGIADSSSNMEWFTVNGAPVGSVVTLSSTLAASVASGARVYVYATATRVTRPLRVLDAYVLYTSGGTRNKLNIIDRDSYFKLGNLTATGTPNQMYYDPQLDNGTFYVYTRFSGGDNVIEFTYHRPFEDFDAAGDTPDFPQEWYLPLMLELAFLIAAGKGIPLEERMQLMKEVEFYKQSALSQGYPEGSVYFQPSIRNG